MSTCSNLHQCPGHHITSTFSLYPCPGHLITSTFDLDHGPAHLITSSCIFFKTANESQGSLLAKQNTAQETSSTSDSLTKDQPSHSSDCELPASTGAPEDLASFAGKTSFACLTFARNSSCSLALLASN